jgi:hypothetical protein
MKINWKDVSGLILLELIFVGLAIASFILECHEIIQVFSMVVLFAFNLWMKFSYLVE